jgi:disulfide bond formation protein DsbB
VEGDALSRTESFWPQYGPYLALGTALTATLGALYYGEIAGLAPCNLCWYQRILMFPLVAILFIGILKHDEGVFDYVLPFSILGIGVSAYHYLIQMGVIGESAVCSVNNPCSKLDVVYLGFVTIPLMSLAAFTIITAVMALGKWASRGAEDVAALPEDATEKGQREK